MHDGSELCTSSAGTCPPDQTTFDYVRERTAEPFEPVYADDSASYIQEYRFDVSKLEPLVAAPHSPDNRKNAAECRDVKIDRVYIGCAARSGFPCVLRGLLLFSGWFNFRMLKFSVQMWSCPALYEVLCYMC